MTIAGTKRTLLEALGFLRRPERGPGLGVQWPTAEEEFDYMSVDANAEPDTNERTCDLLGGDIITPLRHTSNVQR